MKTHRLQLIICVVGLALLSLPADVLSQAKALFFSVRIATGTITTSTPALDISQTWNQAGHVFTAIKVNVTSTASGNQSKLMDLQLAGASMFSVLRGGTVNGTAFSTLSVFTSDVTSGTVISQTGQLLADGDVLQLGTGTSTRFISIAISGEDRVGLAALQASNNAVDLIYNGGSKFSTTEGNASTVNIYWHAGSSTYRLQNKLGLSRTFRIVANGI